MDTWDFTVLLLSAGWSLYLCIRIAHQWQIHKPGEGAAAAVRVFAHPFLLLFIFQAATGFENPGSIPSWIRLPGISIFLSGIGMLYAAHRTLGKNYEAAIALKNPSALVTTGPYAIMRHPIYFGALLMGIGTELALASPYMLIVILLMPLIVWQIHREERLLSSVFKDAWAAYKNNTPYKILPYIF